MTEKVEMTLSLAGGGVACLFFYSDNYGGLKGETHIPEFREEGK
jgi:hypothetical protein